MGPVTAKKVLSIMALCAMVTLLVLPVVVSLPSPAAGEDAALRTERRRMGTRSRRGAMSITRRKASWSVPRRRRPTDGPKDYPRYNFESRVLLWFANQQHLYYGSFVLAVPIFCMVIEFMGIVTQRQGARETLRSVGL